MSKQTFDPGEIIFVSDGPEDFQLSYLEAARKAALDRKRRFGSKYKALDKAIGNIEREIETRRAEQH